MHYIPDDPYSLEIEAIDSILPGEVVVVSTSESIRNAPWGELMSTAARTRGARGAIVDGLIRDVKTIEMLGFQIFASGIKPVDSRGRGQVVDYNVPIECGGVLVHPGDLIVADYDGVVAIPADLVAPVVERARAKASKENQSRAALVNGAYLSEVYAKYGVL
jgi:regulator of RNase E activity RraA